MSSNKTDSAVDDIKSGLKGIRGVGDALRGTFNQGVDHAFNEPEGEAKNAAIAQKGEQDIRNADRAMGGHNTTANTTTTAGAGTTSSITGGVCVGAGCGNRKYNAVAQQGRIGHNMQQYLNMVDPEAEALL